jgi:6-phosphogluconolactonase (cycloisomerase 2 family)
MSGQLLIAKKETFMFCASLLLKSRLALLLSLASAFLLNSLVMAQSAHFVYVVNELSDTVSGYSIDAASGELTPLPGSPFSTSHMPHRLVISPSGTYAYLVTDDSSSARLVTFSIDRHTGALVMKGNQPIPSPSFAVPSIEPAGRLLFLANSRTGEVSVYGLDPSSGIPSLIWSAHAGNLPWSSTIDSLGKFAFFAGNSNRVAGYIIDAQKRTLTPVAGSPFLVMNPNAFPGPRPMSQIAVLHSSGNFLYVTDPLGGNISAFSVDRSDGSIHSVAGSPFSAQGIIPFEAVVSHSRFLYVGDWHRGLIGAFCIAGSGGLAPVAGSPFRVSFTSGSARSGGIAISVDPSGDFLYATSTEKNEIVAFRIDPSTGILMPLPGGPLPTGKHPFRIAISP